MIHVGKRLQAHPEMKLPVIPLLNIWASNDTSMESIIMTVSYIAKGFDRASAEEKFDLVRIFIS